MYLLYTIADSDKKCPGSLITKLKSAHLTPIDKDQVHMSYPPIGSSVHLLRRSAAPLLHRSPAPPVTPLPSLVLPTQNKMSSTRFNPRRWRKLSFIFLVFINLFAISILFPHLFNNHVSRSWEWDWKFSDRPSLHRLQSDGRLEVNMHGRHPILELMALGEAKWNRMTRRYSSFPSQPLQPNVI